MAWEKFNPNLVAHDLVQDLKWNTKLRKEFKDNEAAVLDRYKMSPEERKAIETRDFRALYDPRHASLSGRAVVALHLGQRCR